MSVRAKSEAKTIGIHAGTVVIGQLATMSYAVADSIIAGRYASEALAAFSVGMAIYISIFVALMGVIQGLMPLLAEAHGAGKNSEVGVLWRQSLYLCVGLTAVGAIVLLFPQALLNAAQVPEALQSTVRSYLAVQSLTLLPALVFRSFTTMSQAVGLPKWVAALQISALPVKVALSVWFVFGGWGLAGMGAVGCAVATFCVQLALVVAAYLLMKHQRDYVLFVPLVGFDCIEKPDPITLKRFLKLGIPGGLAMLFEVTSFTLMAVLIARMGVETAAAHQIAANTAAVMFMLPLSLSVACSARVSYWMGAGDKASSILALKLGLGLVLSCAVLMSGLTAAIAQHIPSAYTKSPVVASTATALVLWVCLYHVGDALQTLCVYALRSFYVTVAPFLVYAVALWGLGLGGGWWLAYGDRAPGSVGLGHPSGFWMAASASVAVTAAIFSWMLWRRARSFAKAQTALA